MDMRKTTFIYAALLILLGLIGYFGFGRVSVTALIPAFFGVILYILALIAAGENRRKHAMHAAAALALIGFLATVGGLYQTLMLISGGTVTRPQATVSKGIMSLLSLIYVSIAIRSFVLARLSRKDN